MEFILLACSVVQSICFIWVLVGIFLQKGIIWGILGIFCGIYTLLFGLLEWESSYKWLVMLAWIGAFAAQIAILASG